MELELRRVQEERLAVTDSVCEILADIPSSEMASLFRASAGHVQKKLAMRSVARAYIMLLYQRSPFSPLGRNFC